MRLYLLEGKWKLQSITKIMQCCKKMQAILCSIKKKNPRILIPSYLAPVMPQVEDYVQLWAAHFNSNPDQQETVQRRVVRGLESKAYKKIGRKEFL